MIEEIGTIRDLLGRRITYIGCNLHEKYEITGSIPNPGSKRSVKLIALIL